MKILGVHLRSHDASVVLIKDNKILFAASNERFSRIKMDRQPPILALKACLKYANTKPKDIDKVVFVEDPFPKSLWVNFKDNVWPITSTKGENLLWLKRPSLMLAQIAIASGIPAYLYRSIWPILIVKKALKGFEGEYLYHHHHMAHAHVAYYSSGWDTCLTVVAEGSGFDETMSIWHVVEGEWKKIAITHLPHSAGKFYETVTELLGFNRHRHPGKVTGLAAYGDPRPAYRFVKNFLWVDGLELRLDYKRHLKLWYYYFLNKKMPGYLTKYKKEDLAAAFQKRLEECITDIIKKVVEKTGEHRIALSGGIFANVKLNERIHELDGVEQIHIHQAMGDDGLAMGAALHTAYLSGFKPGRPDTVYFGPDYKDGDIVKALKKYRVKYRKSKNIEKEVAKLLSKGKVVGRFNGRMEYGPRALGNRTILYKTQDKTVNDWLNKRLKRTEFMPFAPVTLRSHAEDCYENLEGAEYPARFMTVTFQCTPGMKEMSPAVVHVDGTARPQLISKEDNESYYKILFEYYKLTGVPSLINTSFNMHEEPIVCSPEDAIRSFLVGSIDYLAIADYIVSLEENMDVAEEARKKFVSSLEKKKPAPGSVLEFLRH